MTDAAAVNISPPEDPEDVCPSSAIPSIYGEAYLATVRVADNWINNNAAALDGLGEGLFDWGKTRQPGLYAAHVKLEAELDDLAEKRAPIEKFNAILRRWGRVYCNLAYAAHQAMLAELNLDLQAARPAVSGSNSKNRGEKA